MLTSYLFYMSYINTVNNIPDVLSTQSVFGFIFAYTSYSTLRAFYYTPCLRIFQLLGVPKDDFIFALTNKTIKAHDEVIQSGLDVETSTFAKDALAKAIYSRLFEWLVAHINKTLKTTVRKKDDRVNKNKSIGILDIYGFEILQNNG